MTFRLLLILSSCHLVSLRRTSFMDAKHTHPIDLRSDTVTKPTPAMRKAMAEAEVGDDVYGEDPTVNRLEAMVAEMLGKEAAVFVSSGTMGNLVSVLSHCGRGDEMILGDRAHIFRSEQGGAAALGGVQPYILPNQPDGTLDLQQIEAAIRADNEHYPITKLICLENTHNSCGGRVLPVAYMDAVGQLAHRRGLQLHVDGARLWNAAVALDVAPARLLQHADSVSVCLSKGLGAPVGSVVAGSSEFIRKARRNRKVVGGSMRQAGVIAAAGIVAISEMVERLADDHANARQLAQGLAQIDGITIDPDGVETNLVFFELVRDDITPSQLSAALAGRGVLMNPAGERRLRAALNHHVSAEDVETTVAVIQAVLANGVSESGEKVLIYN
jgi:threonine aldolase